MEKNQDRIVELTHNHWPNFIKWTRNPPILLSLLAFICFLTVHLPSSSPEQINQLPNVSGAEDKWCALPDPIFPPDDGLKPSDHLVSPEQLALQIKRLAAAVQVPTESYDDNGDVDEDPRWAPFQDLHQRLEQLFPLVHKTLTPRKINKHALLYTLPGTQPAIKPILLTAHQDVVPAAPTASWTHPPYAGHYDGANYLWGRGAADCKNVLVGLLSVIEDLLSQSFAPRRTVVLAFGFDEETGGMRGAAELGRVLEEEWGREGFLFLLDEGGMGVRGEDGKGGVIYAYPGVGEKGYYDVRLTLNMAGGHSSRPPRHTAIGIMADVIVALEGTPYTPRLTQSSPFRRVLECQAKHSPDNIEPWLRDALLSGEEQEIAEKLAEDMPDDRWLMQTSQAIDIIAGGVKINALPQHVEVLVNHRVASHESAEYVNKHIKDLLVPVAKKHGLQLSSENASASGTAVLGLTALQALPPAPISPTDNGVWALFSGTVRQVFEGTDAGRGKVVVPVGNVMTGNTDTVHYWNLTKNIYRFTPAREGTRLNAHGIDERMEMLAHLEGMRLYYGNQLSQPKTTLRPEWHANLSRPDPQF